MKKILLLLLIVLLSVSTYSQTKIRFMPHWYPQAQFAGYYYALEMGIYKKYGLDVEILPYRLNLDYKTLFTSNQIDFASMWLSQAMLLKNKQTPIRLMAQLMNKSSVMIIAKKSSGIKTLKDLTNKKLGVWCSDFIIQPDVFIKKYGLNLRQIEQGNSINLFLMNGVQATCAMIYNEYHTIIKSGLDSNQIITFNFSDYGLNIPEEGIYCNEQLSKSNPEAYKKFITATLEGWMQAFKNQDKALEIVMKKCKAAHIATNLSHQRWMLKKMQELMLINGKFDILLKESDYIFLQEKLIGYKFINRIIPFKDFIYQ